MDKDKNQSQIILYQTEDGKTRVEVRFEHENVWLSQKIIAALFDTSVPNINMHLKNIFSAGELTSNSVIKEFLITASDGYISDFDRVVKELEQKAAKRLSGKKGHKNG